MPYIGRTPVPRIGDVIDDTTPQLGGDLDANGAQIQWSKGADVASATALPVLTDGNYFDVTGTVTVTSINATGGAGTLIKLHFDAILTLTHHATDLILPSGASITTAAGDEAEFIEYAAGDYRCTNYSKASGEAVVGVSSVSLDSPSITGTLSLDNGGNVSHTISNWSDDITYVITPTNCTVGSINTSGIFVVTHTSGVPSYTIKATTDSLGLDDSALVTKNLTTNLSAPTINSPANTTINTSLSYIITSTDSNDDKLILDLGTTSFGTISVDGGASVTTDGNTIICTGFGTNNPTITFQFTALGTYAAVKAKSVKIDGTYGDSAYSASDSIIIYEQLSAPSLNAPADTDDATAVTYTISSINANATKVIFDAQSSNFTYGSVGSGSGSKEGNTVEITGWSGTSVTVTLTYTTVATYSNRAKVTNSADATYTDSAYSSTDSIVISASSAATGGTVSTSGSYTYHTFTSSGTFQVTSASLTSVAYLVVAGGGGGGSGHYGGGGGAGGVSYHSGKAVSVTSYGVTVGGGGPVSTDNKGGNGDDSSFHSTTSNGGGGGGAYGSYYQANTGGSGGGGGSCNYCSPRGAAASNQGDTGGATGYGNSGGNSSQYNNGAAGGGGGGAGSSGSNAPGTFTGGAGGAGKNTWSDWATATSTGVSGYYAGGGGGAGYSGSGNGAGGSGGGGAGTQGSPNNGTQNTGGGGGGATATYAGTGGSGVVIIRY
jgi:hypothetical protein